MPRTGRPVRDPVAPARVKEFLDRNVGEPVRLEDLAGVAGVSRNHVIRVFRRAYGITPFQYRRSVRLRRAEQMLREGLRAVDVAYEMGFADQSHLCAAMRAARNGRR